MKRIVLIAGLALMLLAACEPAHQTARRASAVSARPTPTASSTNKPTWTARPPYLTQRTHIRLLASGGAGLELIDIDTGTMRILVRPSDANGDVWGMYKVAGGVIAKGSDDMTGDGAPRHNVWYIPNGATPQARLLGPATAVVDEPAGGIWLVDMPNNSGGFGSGTVTLVDTQGELVRRGTAHCCQSFEASLGNGRFVTEKQEGHQGPPNYGYQGLTVYDVFSKRTIRRLTPPGTDAEFLRMEGRAAVWKPYECKDPCLEHVTDTTNGRDHTRRWNDWLMSPDGAHRAKTSGPDEARSLLVDGTALSNGATDEYATVEWAPDSSWLIFERPDREHLGLWRVGSPAAVTARRTFSIFYGDWTVFDQR